jgi:hypothetical protein
MARNPIHRKFTPQATIPKHRVRLHGIPALLKGKTLPGVCSAAEAEKEFCAAGGL